jgi:probable HAF family extracellular repeat protein
VRGVTNGVDAVNNRGQFVGYSTTGNQGAFHASLFTPGSSQVDLGTLGGGAEESLAFDINNSGEVVGSSTLTGGVPPSGPRHAFLYRHGRMIDLGTLGGTSSAAFGINDRGDIVGAAATASSLPGHAFLLNEGGMIDLGALGGTNSYAYRINNRGQIIGTAYTADGNGHAFLYGHGHMSDLGTLGGISSTARAINERGQIIGFSFVNGNGATHGFLYSDGTMIDLNDAIPPGSGWVIRSADGINSSGQIAGTGILDGQVRALILTPVRDNSKRREEHEE